MINPVQTSIPQEDGNNRYVIIEPILQKDGAQGLHSTGVYKIYKDAFGDETHLFTDPGQSSEPVDDLPDSQNPDYIGRFIFEDGDRMCFEGEVLSLAEQAYLAVFIERYEEPDV
jgi:hypothetical protein